MNIDETVLLGHIHSACECLDENNPPDPEITYMMEKGKLLAKLSKFNPEVDTDVSKFDLFSNEHLVVMLKNYTKQEPDIRRANDRKAKDARNMVKNMKRKMGL